MALLINVRAFVGRVAQWLGGGRRNEFTCGDCAMNARCGLPPSEDCVARAAQIASGRPRRRPLPDLDASY